MTMDVNDEWLEAAEEIATVFASVPMDFSGSSEAWRYGGGRDLDDLVAKARDPRRVSL